MSAESQNTLRLTGIDHLVVTVFDMEEAVFFYTKMLGCELIEFDSGRKALQIGNQKINLHLLEEPALRRARYPLPGTTDICLVVDATPEETMTYLRKQGVDIEAGPVPRTGALGPMLSVYLRDPDENLIELAHYPPGLDNSGEIQ